MAMIECPECGSVISDKTKNCPQCGCSVKSDIESTETIKEGGRWATGKLIIGIFSVILFFVISIQSCAVGFREKRGSFGIISAVLIVTAGILAIATRNSKKISAAIACCILYGIGALIAYIGAGSYSALKVWGILALSYGCIFMFSIMKNKIQIIVSAVSCLVFSLLLIITLFSNTTENKIIKNNTKSENNYAGSSGNKTVTIEKQELLKHEGLIITATGLVNDPIWGKGVKVLMENNSDNNLGITCNALIVNNYMISDVFSTEVGAGKKATDTIGIFSSGLEAAGINNIGKIELYFHIFDINNYDMVYDSERILIKTSDYKGMDTKSQINGIELINQNEIKIFGKYVDETSFWGNSVLLYIENNSGKNAGIECDSMSINGYMQVPFFTSVVFDKKKAIDHIEILSSDLEDNNIKRIQKIELRFRAYDTDTDDTLFESGTIALDVKQ